MRGKKLNLNFFQVFLPTLIAFPILVLSINKNLLIKNDDLLTGNLVTLPQVLILREENDTPQRINIPKISANIAIKKAFVEKGTWQTFDDSASFGVGSSYLNNAEGSTVVFAHARNKLFSKLNDLKEGDFIYVYGSLKPYEYRVNQKMYVYPDDISFLAQNFGKSLILFTCYGPSDEKRVIVVAGFVENRESASVEVI